MPIMNAKIAGTTLGYEGHGMLTAFIYLDYGGSQQGFGGYRLDAYDKEEKKEVPTKYCGAWIAGILKAVGVDKWEDLEGKYVRVEREDGGWNSRISAIGNIVEDKWFRPRDLPSYG